MSLFQKKIGQVFLKEKSDVMTFIEKMTALSDKSSGYIKKEIDREIRLAYYGMEGERKIEFELKNSGIDMYVLHDIYLESEENSAQIDYMVFTRKHIYIIECKNLIGDISVDSEGNFVRKYELYGKTIKEGIYSPITQNERHLQVIKDIIRPEKGLIAQKIFDKGFYNDYISLIVLANPKTILNDRYAKKEVKNKIYRADQLIRIINEMDGRRTDYSFTEKEMCGLANFYLKSSKSNKSDYAKKYEKSLEELEKTDKDDSLQQDDTSSKILKPEMANSEITKPGVTDSKNEKQDIDNLVLHKADNKTEKKICPKCGKPMTIRTAKKGPYIGNKFWGCTGYPYCRYISAIDAQP